MENYNVLKILGEGSFGRVLLVHHKEKNQKYAMKEIRLPKSALDTENSWNESVLLAKMKHPNIVAFTESFAADGHLYIVMEHCDDGDLMEKIRQRRGKSFPEDMILHWFVQICLGVKYIHDKRVLHRDLKSKNIFLTQQGNIKLGDFGSALLLNSPTAYACSYVGTPYYVPPEIWENLPYNNKSDIWSLGCILYELCTLKHPFQASSWKHLILKICKGYYSPLPSQFSYELHYLIKQMLKKNPKNRPSASTILTRKCLAKHIRKFSSTKEEGKCERNKDSCSGAEATPNYSCQRGLEKTCVDIKAADFLTPQRRQWEKRRSNTVMNILENASLIVSRTSTMEDTSGSMRKPDEKVLRKQWTKEPPETLMNILHNADISLAFNTYTVYKAGNPLRGPLTEDTKASDEPDGDIIVEDPESLEPRSDEEDTDFEEEHNPDWISELKRITKMND